MMCELWIDKSTLLHLSLVSYFPLCVIYGECVCVCVCVCVFMSANKGIIRRKKYKSVLVRMSLPQTMLAFHLLCEWALGDVVCFFFLKLFFFFNLFFKTFFAMCAELAAIAADRAKCTIICFYTQLHYAPIRTLIFPLLVCCHYVCSLPVWWG